MGFPQLQDITTTQLLVCVLVFLSVFFVGTAVVVLRASRKRADRRHQLRTWTGDESEQKKKASGLTSFFEKVGNFVSHGHASTNLWEQLVRAGFLGRSAPAVYTGIKMLLFMGGLAIGAVLFIPSDLSIFARTILVCSCGIIPFFMPNLVVLRRESRRREDVRLHLPDVIDLLEICVSSGIGLDMAWNMVADEAQAVSPILASAMDLSNFEMHLGVSRAEAMRNMARRTGADQLSSLAAILVQSERFGTSVATALKEFAISMREERRLMAEESAEKMAPKLIVPMVLFIFPAIIIIVVGPAVVNIVRVLLTT